MKSAVVIRQPDGVTHRIRPEAVVRAQLSRNPEGGWAVAVWFVGGTGAGFEFADEAEAVKLVEGLVP
jgi:hypothetical protein